MKAPRTEAGLETFVEALFSRFPGLLGFSVQDAEGELVLADMETQPWSAQPQEILGDVAVALLDLVDEEPDALELLRGRTFARTLH